MVAEAGRPVGSARFGRATDLAAPNLRRAAAPDTPPPAPCRRTCRLPPGTDPRAIDYSVKAARAAPFYAAIRAYLPALPDGCLEPAYSGVRPKARFASLCCAALRCAGSESLLPVPGKAGHVG